MGFGFLSAGHGTKGFYQFSVIMGLLTPGAVKVTAKYCVSLDFRPSTMEFSTRHLALCNRIYLSGCSQFNQVGTGHNWFLTHVK